MRYGIVGTGYWGSNHVRVCTELKEKGVIDELIVCDANEDRAQEVADAYGLPYLASHEELLDRDVDAVTVASPSPTHHDIATSLMAEGVDVLVEKPLALNADDAWDMVKTADRNECTIGVGHIFRYHPALGELKERIDRGELGTIKYIHTNRFAFRVPRTTAGVLYSLAIHDVDIYTYLLERKPERMYCKTSCIVRDDVDETATVIMDYGDVYGVINESWQIPVFGKRRDLVVVGSEKAAYVDYLRNTELEIYDSRVTTRDGTLAAIEEGEHVHETADVEPLRAEVEDFIKASRSDSQPLASGEVGAEAIELLEYAEQSAAARQSISLD